MTVMDERDFLENQITKIRRLTTSLLDQTTTAALLGLVAEYEERLSGPELPRAAIPSRPPGKSCGDPTCGAPPLE
jgi:hypothetical protein